MGEKGNVPQVTDTLRGYGDGSPMNHLTQSAAPERVTGFGSPGDAPVPPAAGAAPPATPGHRAPGLGAIGGMLGRDEDERPDASS